MNPPQQLQYLPYPYAPPIGTTPRIIANDHCDRKGPIRSKLVKYVDFSKLLGGLNPLSDEAAMIIEGPVVKLEAPQRGYRKQSSINDIFTWLQVYSKVTALMLSSSMTSNEEAAGLAAHMDLIQLQGPWGGPSLA